jgi:NCS2 family nucleobase:cation symporter-2
MKDSTLYHIDGRMPLLEAVPFGLQHVLAMFVSNITPIIILANVVGISPQLSAILIQNCMVIAGIGTLIQLYPIWRIGSRLPIVMGISFTFLSLNIFIATSQGMGVLIGAVIIGGLVEGLLGLFAKYWIKLVPHLVAATVVTAIGFSLLPIGANSFAGGVGAEDFGSLQNWIVGSFTLLVCLGFQVFAKGFFRSLSVLFGLIAGYILAACMGMVHFHSMEGMSFISLPQFLPFKPEFELGAILSVIAIYLVSATETIGDTSALCNGALHRNPHKEEMGASISCDGFVSSLAGLFGCTPITSFSQNVGLAAMSGVVNRFAIATGACIMILGGIFPAIGMVLTTIPQAVLGGCSIMMFGSIMFAGFGMMSRCGFSNRNMIVVSLSLSIGLGFTQASGMFTIFPQIFRTIFAENCVAVVFILAVLLNLILPNKENVNPVKRDKPTPTEKLATVPDGSPSGSTINE